MKVIDKTRGANLRRNLRRWWKPLLVMNVAWLVLTVVVCAIVIIYAHQNHLSTRRVQMLGSSCGTIMGIVLSIAWIIVFVIADRKKPE